MNDSIKKMLRITDKHITITEVTYEMRHQKQPLVIEATLSPSAQACKSCGSSVTDETGKTIVVKNGTKKTAIRFDQYHHMPLVMYLKKQQYTCKNCQHHWNAQSHFVRPRHSISNQVKFKIVALSTEKVSLSFIAKFCYVSLSTVIHILKELKNCLPNYSKKSLPKVLMVDEFRSHASLEDKMSFICADGETGQLVDILPSRKPPRLTDYFLQCSNLKPWNF